MSEWRTIDSAPLDGSRIIAAEPDVEGWTIGVAVWRKTPHVPLYGFHFTEGDPESWDIAKPTHWMSMPDPPKT
jgi:hypothetical protein